MRKIERKMIDAIRDRRNMRDGNTTVVFHDGQTLGAGYVALHDNVIAVIMNDGRIRLNLRVLREWQTVTTRSRVKALGFDAHIRGGRLHVEGVPV